VRRWIVFLLLALCAVASAAKFTTQRFDGQYAIDADGTVHIREIIGLTFTEPQRGLIRKIPFRTRSSKGSVRTVQLSLDGVTQDDGSGPQPAETKVSEDGGDWSIRIGNANRFLNGPVTYVIDYSVVGAITPFLTDEKLGQHTEFLWNLTPTAWATPIESAAFEIRFPKPEPGPVLARILLGPRGTRQGIQIDDSNKVVGNTQLLSARFEGTSLKLQAGKRLAEGESITLGLSLPGETVQAPAPDIRLPNEGGFSRSNPDIQIPRPPEGLGFLGFAPLLAIPIAYAFSRRGWAPPKKPLVVRFDPPEGVGPSLAGLIHDGDVDQHDIVAGIVSLAQKGGIRMHHGLEGAEGVTLELLGANRLRNAEQFDLSLYKALEPYGPVITPDALRGTFGPSYNSLVGQLHVESRVRGFMKDVSGTKALLGCFLFLGVGIVTFLTFIFNPCMAVISAVAAFVIGSSLINRVSPLAPLGHDAKWKLDGLYEFISRAHQKELNYMSQRMPDQALFENLLPYAVAFNLVQQWTKAFEGIDLQMPDWYAGSDYGAMDMLWTGMLMHDLMHMDQSYGDSMAYTLPTTSFGSGDSFSSGDSGFGGDWGGGGGGFGGGFDGGGGGGGGGGDSW
jgi:uncharacterized membrane protein YgcG